MQEFLSAGFHPYHQHVNPFQIVAINLTTAEARNMTTGAWESTWYQVGDWHDTFMHATGFAQATLRWQVDQFAGHMVMHCHMFPHEDKGMMAQYDIQGVEGTTWDGAVNVDPKCIAPKGNSEHNGGGDCVTCDLSALRIVLCHVIRMNV